MKFREFEVDGVHIIPAQPKDTCEEEIQVFLEEKIIIDIQYSMSFEDRIDCYSALILYKNKEE